MQTLTINSQDFENIQKFVNSHQISKGVGTYESACSIASINLALTGKLADNIPDCMSPIIGHWIISVQDQVSHAMRNTVEWRALLPFAAGTGRNPEKEIERVRILRAWFHENMHIANDVLDAHGLGEKWKAAQENFDTVQLNAVLNEARYKLKDLKDVYAGHGGFFMRADVQVMEAVIRAIAGILSTFVERSRRDYCGAEVANGAHLLVCLATYAVEHEKRENVALDMWTKIDPTGVLAKLVK